MDIPLNENKLEEISKKENIESEIINVKIVKQEKLKQKYYEETSNINSPQLIQEILQLSTKSTQNDYQHQNKLIKSLYAFNDSILPILENDFIDNNNINFNPRIQFLSQRNKLTCMNFEQINKKNNFLLNKIEQYNDLKKKLSDYKTNNFKENNDNTKELNLKLFLVNHPLINLFKNEIDIKGIKKDIEKEYQKKMKDNSDYKPGPLNPYLINIQEQEDSQNEEDEIIEESENSNEESVEEPGSASHDNSYIEMMEPIQPNQALQPNQPDQPEQPNQPIQPIQPINLEQNENNQIIAPQMHEIQANDNENEENNNDVPINLNNNNIEPINEQNNQLQINLPLNIANPLLPIINLENPLPNLNPSPPPIPDIIQPPNINNIANLQSESIHHNELMDLVEMEDLLVEEINNNNEVNEQNQNNDINDNQNEEENKDNNK